MATIEKARYWQAIMYPENMIENWRDVIESVFQVPFAYCVHDKDIDGNKDKRKEHIHVILAFSNTTTYNNALRIFKTIEKVGKSAIPNDKIQQVNSIRKAYDYLIHNTEDSKKKGKYLYDKSERITGNDFDIGNYEQISLAEKNNMCKELCDYIVINTITNFADFYMYVIENFDSEYFEVIKGYSGLFERLTKANYQKVHRKKKQN